MAAMYGLLLGIITVVLSTCGNMMVNNFIGFYATQVLAFIISVVMLGVFAARIRKANGGYITFKEVFGVVIVMVFIACFISLVYNIIYLKYIDPGFMDKVKASTIHFMEGKNIPDEQIDEAVKKFDKQMAESKNFNIGKTILAYFESCIFYCLFGLIVCAIVKKNKPVFFNG